MVRFLAILLSAGLVSATTSASPSSRSMQVQAWWPGVDPRRCRSTPPMRRALFHPGLAASKNLFPDTRPVIHHADPYTDDPVLFTITAANMDSYADQLSEGQKALLERYPDSWRMNVYASRRSAAYPDFVYAAFKSNASSATGHRRGPWRG